MYIPINEEVIEDIVIKNDAREIGILISLLCYYYLKYYDVTEKDIIKSLKNSIKILKNEEKINKE